MFDIIYTNIPNNLIERVEKDENKTADEKRNVDFCDWTVRVVYPGWNYQHLAGHILPAYPELR